MQLRHAFLSNNIILMLFVVNIEDNTAYNLLAQHSDND